MAQRISGFERKDADLYQTPAHVVDSLLSVVRINGPVLEPACGEGQIVDALRSHGYEVTGSDITLYCQGQDYIGDFIAMRGAFGCNCILTNPPYGQGGKLAVAFIEHALELMRPVKGQVWMLLPSDYDHPKGRRHLFAECPEFTCKVVLHDRVKWFDGEGSPSENHAWFGWDWFNIAAPSIRYASNPVEVTA